MRQVKLTRLMRLPRHEIGRGPVQVAIDTKGKPFIWSAERIDRRSDAEGEYRFLRYSGDAIEELPIPPQMGLHPQLYPFVDGRLLLVFHRSVRGNGDNAAVFARDGTLLTRFRTGDAVADVQITARGDIWVAYFDETIEAELDCFDHQGRKVFSYDTFRETHNLPMMVDCYAVNTSSDVDTWIYYYPNFPLVHLSEGEYAGHWDTSAVQGARAIAVDGERVLFAGRYKARDSLFLFELGTGAIEELQLVHERGQPIPLANCHGTGRGTQLYLHGGWFLYTVDLAEIS